MKLSTRCRYAALALFDIAYHAPEDAPAQIKQIAERQGIPARFLEQIFQDLKRAELVDGKRGRKGGYHLRRAPEAITLADIIRATEGPLEGCLAGELPPGQTGTASSGHIPSEVWAEAVGSVIQVFEQFSVGDMVARAEAAGVPRSQSGYMYFI